MLVIIGTIGLDTPSPPFECDTYSKNINVYVTPGLYAG